MERCGIRRRCPRTKRVLRWSSFALRGHAQTIREREKEKEREREREREKSTNQQEVSKKDEKVRMHE